MSNFGKKNSTKPMIRAFTKIDYHVDGNGNGYDLPDRDPIFSLLTCLQRPFVLTVLFCPATLLQFATEYRHI